MLEKLGAVKMILIEFEREYERSYRDQNTIQRDEVFKKLCEHVATIDQILVHDVAMVDTLQKIINVLADFDECSGDLIGVNSPTFSAHTVRGLRIPSVGQVGNHLSNALIARGMHALLQTFLSGDWGQGCVIYAIYAMLQFAAHTSHPSAVFNTGREADERCATALDDVIQLKTKLTKNF